MDTIPYRQLRVVRPAKVELKTQDVHGLNRVPSKDVLELRESANMEAAVKRIARGFSEERKGGLSDDFLNGSNQFFSKYRRRMDRSWFYYAARQSEIFFYLRDQLKSAIVSGDPTSALERLIRLRDCDNEPEQVAHLVLLGKLQSLRDRNEAAETFAEALARDSEDLVGRFFVDSGARSYFSEPMVDMAELEEARSEVVGGFVEAGENRGVRSDASLLVAMDEKFFRVYGIQFYAMAQQLPHLDFDLVLCCSPEDAARLAEEGERLARSLAKFNLLPVPENVSTWSLATPAVVRDRRAFFASARFFAASELFAHRAQMYLADADLMFTKDPSAYMRSRKEKPVYSSDRSRGVSSLSPWRRYTAGSVIVNRSDGARRFLADVQQYVCAGFSLPQAWTVDQNALAYASSDRRISGQD
ncbi:hypothetical protein [Serinicoccus sp. CNJ-927]|uniref:hypothetical protein n=1 Tax=Serinicoccus sp. CNJ-927 TaxID=1904970 RepID=UPI00117B73B7|nr:hypothetical protein [Serinicoccus sp. CNJ-927]